MLKLRKLIREQIEKIYQEMVERPDQHFAKREYERLYGPNTNFPGNYPKYKTKVEEYIQFLRNLKVTADDAVLSFYINSPQVYTYTDPSTNRDSSSNMIWIFGTGNELDSIMFKKKYEVGRSDLEISLEKLKQYIDAKGEMTLDYKDISKLKNFGKPVNPPKEKQNIVKIKDTPYIVDSTEEKIFKKNNPKLSYPVWDVVDNKIEELPVDEKTKDEILSYLIK
jgi:hypothetical protein